MACEQAKRERQKEYVSDLDSSHDARARQEASTTRVVDHTNNPYRSACRGDGTLATRRATACFLVVAVERLV
jgi:hypothetical protein